MGHHTRQSSLVSKTKSLVLYLVLHLRQELCLDVLDVIALFNTVTAMRTGIIKDRFELLDFERLEIHVLGQFLRRAQRTNGRIDLVHLLTLRVNGQTIHVFLPLQRAIHQC